MHREEVICVLCDREITPKDIESEPTRVMKNDTGLVHMLCGMKDNYYKGEADLWS